jgi:hypothetical protein
MENDGKLARRPFCHRGAPFFEFTGKRFNILSPLIDGGEPTSATEALTDVEIPSFLLSRMTAYGRVELFGLDQI